MKVLVVGGAGYLGGAVTDLLMQSNEHKFRVYDALIYEDCYRKDVDFVFGDIRDRKKLTKELKWADAVVWLAALVGDGACAINPHISTELNHLALAWMAENFDGRIIFMSTCSVYGAQEGILDEKSPINPLSVYAVTKFAAEVHLKSKNAVIFRLGTLFGVSDEFSRVRLDLVVNTMTAKAYAEGKLSVYGGAQYRPLLHVKDAAMAIMQSLNAEHKGIYNLHKTNVKISELADEVKLQFPKIEVEKIKMKFEDSRNYRVSSDLAKKTFGFSPQYTVADGVAELKKILEEGRIRELNNARYTNQVFLSQFSTHLLEKEHHV